jgi:hypothetical protein
MRLFKFTEMWKMFVGCIVLVANNVLALWNQAILIVFHEHPQSTPAQRKKRGEKDYGLQ